MDLNSFSDVSLDTLDNPNFHSCESSSDAEVIVPSTSDHYRDSDVFEGLLPSSSWNDFANDYCKLYPRKPSTGSDFRNPLQVNASIRMPSNPFHHLSHSSLPADWKFSVVDAAFQTPHSPDSIYGRSIASCEQTQDCLLEEHQGLQWPPEQYVDNFDSPLCTSAADDRVSELHSPESSSASVPPLCKRLSKGSIIDGLLFEIYDKHSGVSRRRGGSIDGSSTDYSSVSETQVVRSDTDQVHYSLSVLQRKDTDELTAIYNEIACKVNQKNALLLKCLRSREKNRTRSLRHCDMITAVLQAWSSKTASDSKMKFGLEPPCGGDNFELWRDAITSIVRRPIGLPAPLRCKIWSALATHYIQSLRLDWSKIIQFAFNDKSNPDDDALGTQIVKDLHRTGSSSFIGVENEDDRVILQRVLLGYARWNKITGYCQGFNIIAALILGVTSNCETDSLKIMVYMVDKILPKEYFAYNLRALTVDMAVFRSYLRMKLPRLSAHLVSLQEESNDSFTGANVEPPLTNVFTMQWFLTLFATCLPRETVLKLWDCILIDGSEILIRTALAIWTKLAKRVIRTKTADEFYVMMGTLTRELMEGTIISAEELIQNIYKMAPVPLPMLPELRDKFMYDITPFSAALNSVTHKAALNDDDGEDLLELTRLSKAGDSAGTDNSSYQTTDINLLKKQYAKLKARQMQARVCLRIPKASSLVPIAPRSVAPIAINHLFVGKQLSEQKLSALRSRRRVHGVIQPACPSLNSEPRSHSYTDPAAGNRSDMLALSSSSEESQATSPNTASDSCAKAFERALKEGVEKGEFKCHNHQEDDTVIVAECDSQSIAAYSSSTESDCQPPICTSSGQRALSHDNASHDNTSHDNTSRDTTSHDATSHGATSLGNTSAAHAHQTDAVHNEPCHSPCGVRCDRIPGQESFLSEAADPDYDNVFSSSHSLEQSHLLSSRDITRARPPYSSTVTVQSPSKLVLLPGPSKPFNPFPRPRVGILSVHKAQHGIELGLYKPEHALVYMSPAQRRQLINSDKQSFANRVAAGSKSSVW